MENRFEFESVGDSAPQRGRRQIETHCSDFGSAKDPDSLRNGAGAKQQFSSVTKKCMADLRL